MVIATVLALLALFSLVSILVSAEDPHDRHFDRPDDFSLWYRYGIR